MKKRVSVVIPVYRNEDKFLRIFKKNLKYLQGCEIVIVDDFPASELGFKLPKLKNLVYIHNRRNLGFARAVNLGVRSCSRGLILLLNSDVELVDDALFSALDRLGEDVFAIGIKQKEQQRFVGRNILFFKRGLFHHKRASRQESGITAWAEGGVVFFRRKDFLKIGGFCSLYTPFYWEDIDLSYRAWKAGWRVLFYADSFLLHKHESTIGRYFKNLQVRTISFRNQFIFCWLNLSDANLWMSHILYLFFNIVFFLIKDPVFLLGFFSALVRIPQILRYRALYKDFRQVSDKRILQFFREQIR